MRKIERLRRSTGWIVGGLLLLTAAAVLVLVVPVEDCPYCVMDRAFNLAGSNADPKARPLEGCKFCRFRGRVSLWKSWHWLDHARDPD